MRDGNLYSRPGACVLWGFVSLPMRDGNSVLGHSEIFAVKVC